MSEATLPGVQDIEARLRRGPFHEWLGLKVVSVSEGEIELTATWREEWVVNPDKGYTHGGILAALVDLAADWALVSKTGRGVPTIDLRVDYHRAAFQGGQKWAQDMVDRVGQGFGYGLANAKWPSGGTSSTTNVSNVRQGDRNMAIHVHGAGIFDASNDVAMRMFAKRLAPFVSKLDQRRNLGSA